jgi:hypothetical protein
MIHGARTPESKKLIWLNTEQREYSRESLQVILTIADINFTNFTRERH